MYFCSFFTLNSPKLSRPGSWNDPHLLKLIPERKKLSVKVADMEQNNFNTEERERERDTEFITEL